MNRILVVDDDPALIDFLKLLLESEGYETFDAADGEMALKQIEQVRPEVVLLDYMMPNMDGLDVLRHVSRDYQTSFVVMLTGKGSEEVAVECMKSGAVDYVVKPFDNERLLSVIRHAIRYRDSEMQKRKLYDELQEANQKLQSYIAQLEENQGKWKTQRSSLQTLLNEIGKALESLKQNHPDISIADVESLIKETHQLLK